MEEGHANPGRPRDLAARRAILDATLDLLLEHGYTRLTIEGVAAKARVAKKTIYRWWPTKGDLVLEAAGEHISYGTVPDTGNTREELLIAVGQSFRALSDPVGQILVHEAIGTVEADSSMAEAFRSRWVYPWRESAMKAIQRGVDRGDLPRDLDIALALDVIVGTVLMRAMVAGQTDLNGLDEGVVDLMFLASKPRL